MRDGDGEWSQLLQVAVRVAEQAAAHPAVQQVGAAALQLGASCAAFNLTLAITHVTAGCLRIHTATPLLGPLWGAASVAAASVAAGHFSRSTLATLRLSYRDKPGGVYEKRRSAGGGGSISGSALARALAALPRQLLSSWDGREAMVDAVMGTLLYKVLFRHSFRRLLPSHLAQPGAFGRLHIPTSAAEYSTAAEKAQLSVIFGRDGCHHCGTRVNGVIGDHMPPYKVVRDALAARETASGFEKALARLADSLGFVDKSLKQVYYAQCRACSGLQAQLMRNGTRTTAAPGLWPPELVVHSPGRLATRPASSGMLVGMRYYIDAAVLQSTAGPSGGGAEAGGEVADAGGCGGAGGWEGDGDRKRGGWRWLWEQRPRRGKMGDAEELSCAGGGGGGGGGGGMGELLLVLAGCDDDAGDEWGFDQQRSCVELFWRAEELVARPL